MAIVLSWAGENGEREEWAHVLRLRAGLIAAMQDYASGAWARRALRWGLGAPTG